MAPKRRRRCRANKEGKFDVWFPSNRVRTINTSAKQRAQIMTEDATDYFIGCTIAEQENSQSEDTAEYSSNLTAGSSGPFETRLRQILEGIKTFTLTRAGKNRKGMNGKEIKRIESREATIRQGYMETKRDLAKTKDACVQGKGNLGVGRISLICARRLDPIEERLFEKTEFMRHLHLAPIEFYKKIIRECIKACEFYQLQPVVDTLYCEQEASSVSTAGNQMSRTRKGTVYQKL